MLLIQTFHLMTKEAWAQRGYVLLSRTQVVMESGLKSMAPNTVSFRAYCLFQTGLPLSSNGSSSQTLVFLPDLNCQTWSLWLLSKSSFSTSNPKFPQNPFILSCKIACLCLLQHVSLTFWTLKKSTSDQKKKKKSIQSHLYISNWAGCYRE